MSESGPTDTNHVHAKHANITIDATIAIIPQILPFIIILIILRNFYILVLNRTANSKMASIILHVHNTWMDVYI